MTAPASEIEAAAESIRAGRTLPSSWYSDDRIYELERRLIFARSWQYVGGAAQASKPGDYFTCEVAGAPIVLVRGKDGVLRAFLNICRHRHHPVVQGAGNRPLLTCFYHAWTYDLDGSLVRAPRSEELGCFDRSNLGLRPAAVATWGDMLFVDVSNSAPPLEAALGSVRERALQRGLPVEQARFRGRRSMQVDANWKLVWDNNCECYHCPTVHARWHSQVRLDPEHYWDRRIGPYHYETELALIAHRPSQFAYYAWPSFYFQSSDANYASGAVTARSSMVVLRFQPKAVRSTQVDADIYHVDEIEPAELERRLDQVFSVVLEDKGVCERMQRAHDSGMAEPGTLLKGIDTEDHTLLWQRLVHRAIACPDTPLYAPLDG